MEEVHHTFVIPAHNYTEVRRFVRDNKLAYYTKNTTTNAYYEVVIKNDRDAVLFKMRFNDEIMEGEAIIQRQKEVKAAIALQNRKLVEDLRRASNTSYTWIEELPFRNMIK